MAKELPVSGGRYVALVDDADFEILKEFTWLLYIRRQKSKSSFYARRELRERVVQRYGSDGKKCGTKATGLQPMHRFIMGLGKGGKGELQVDHKNGDTLDNRRENLRLANQAQSSQNRGPWRISRGDLPLLKGVHQERSGRWSASIRINKKLTYLGTFGTPEEAARAYDAAAAEHFGEFAYLNFPPPALAAGGAA